MFSQGGVLRRGCLRTKRSPLEKGKTHSKTKQGMLFFSQHKQGSRDASSRDVARVMGLSSARLLAARIEFPAEGGVTALLPQQSRPTTRARNRIQRHFVSVTRSHSPHAPLASGPHKARLATEMIIFLQLIPWALSRRSDRGERMRCGFRWRWWQEGGTNREEKPLRSHACNESAILSSGTNWFGLNSYSDRWFLPPPRLWKTCIFKAVFIESHPVTLVTLNDRWRKSK